MAKPKTPRPTEFSKNSWLKLFHPNSLVIYGTGSIKAPTSLHVTSIVTLHQYLQTRNYAITQTLHERWHPQSESGLQRRQQQQQLVESTFPFIVAGALLNEEDNRVDEEDGWADEDEDWVDEDEEDEDEDEDDEDEDDDDDDDWFDEENYNPKHLLLSGLVVLTFKYSAVKQSEERTQASRERLQKLLLKTPLLGDSILLMFKEVGECRLHVLIAASPMDDYGQRVRLIMAYLRLACPAVYRRLHNAHLLADARYPVGNDPHAWLRPRSEEGYVTFPVEQARAKMQECERANLKAFIRKRGYGMPRR